MHVYTSEPARNFLTQRGAHKLGKNGVYIPNCVDADVFPYLPPRSLQGLAQIFFNCSAMSAQNVEALANAVELGRKLRERARIDFRMTLVCGPQDRLPSALIQAAKSLEPHVMLMDSVPDLLPLISDATLTVLPYASDHTISGTRLKALEYMSCGRIVVTTPNGVTGIAGLSDREVVQVSTLEDLPERVEAVVRDQASYASRGMQAAEFVRRTYAWDPFIKHYLDTLREVKGVALHA